MAIPVFKRLMLHAMTAASLALGSVGSFAQNTRDMTASSTRSDIPTVYQNMDTVYQMLIHAKPDQNTLAKKDPKTLGKDKILFWGDIGTHKMSDIYLSDVIEQAGEEKKTHFSFQTKEGGYLIPIADLQELADAYQACYPATGKKQFTDIILKASDEIHLNNDLRVNSSMTALSTEAMRSFSKDNLKTIMAHEVGHSQQTGQDLTNDPDIAANLSIGKEYGGDRYMFLRMGPKASLLAVLAIAGYRNKKIAEERNPDKKRELEEKRDRAFGFDRPLAGENTHPSDGNRAQYIIALSEQGANVRVPPYQSRP